uniref:Transposon protein, putative, CACTA, En/Spm sub-class n=1 Tax=Oryza sativa subsp. japonica TaxID=39947 RepID=Q2QW09_ORYSJ|nr:transposon protein, putative, CACTA, En/Spm sub-class [Oryza sativa Japonica Group]
MADHDDEQILYDTIAEGSSQYWNKKEGNEDPNQYLNEEGNVERDAEGNEEGNVERDAEGNEEGNVERDAEGNEEEASGSHPSAGQKRARGQREKEMLWTTMLETFTLPVGTENIVKQWTLKKMVEQFQSFKGDLYKKYILKGLTPNFDVFSKLRDHWDELVAYKTGQQGQAMMTPEHSGRTRGKGVIPWKIGFKEDIHTYRSRMRSKRDTEAKIAYLEYRVSSYELSMQEEVARKVDERMAAHQSHDPQLHIPPPMVSPSGNRSSCASTGQVGSQCMDAMQTQDETTCPVDEIMQRTPCELHIPFKNLSIKVASGMAIPTDISGTYHYSPIPAGYSRVEVELVEAVYEDLELDYPGGDGEVKRQLKPRSPEKKIPIDPSMKNFFKGISTTNKEALKLSDYDRTLRKAYYKKSKPVPQLGEQPNQVVEPLVTGEDFGITDFISDTGLTVAQLVGGAPIPKAEVAYKFELGKPLVRPEQLQSLPTQIYKFHERYMEMSAKGREMFGARIRNPDFLQGEDVLWIHFKDVFDLYHLDALDVSLLGAWILMEIQRARRRGVYDTGFIDPRKINTKMIDKYEKDTEDNLVHLLTQQHFKTFILLPYNTEVTVYDSMNKEEKVFDKVFQLIDRAWDRFRQLVHGTWKEKLGRRFYFPCAKQDQGTNLCGYYVCEYDHCLSNQIYTTRELDRIHMRENLPHKDFITAVQEQLMGFINEEVLNPDGEFYYDGSTIHNVGPSSSDVTPASKS